MIPSECFLNFADSWICTWVLIYSGNIFNLRKIIISLCIFARGYNKSITMRLIDFARKVIEMIILIIYFIFDFDGTDIHSWQDRSTNVSLQVLFCEFYALFSFSSGFQLVAKVLISSGFSSIVLLLCPDFEHFCSTR